MDPRLKAFLSTIAWSEGTSTSSHTQNDGYDIIVDGVDSPHTFSNYLTHPNVLVTVRLNPLLQSTAAGRYQLLHRWYHPYCVQLGLNDFTPASQDAIALQQVKECRAIQLILGGDISSAIKACSNIWASLPGNSYGQGGHSLDVLVQKYNEFGGQHG